MVFDPVNRGGRAKWMSNYSGVITGQSQQYLHPMSRGGNNARVPDAEFVELWRKYQSATKLAEIIGIGVRAVHARRRSLAREHGVQLNGGDVRSKYYEHLAPRQHPARQKVTVRDGVVIAFSDAHFWPGIRSTAFKGLLKCIRDMKPAVVVCNGDAFDGARVSSYPRIGWSSTPKVIDELHAVKDRLGEIEKVAGSARLYWPLGNHDSRYETRLSALAPEYEGVKGFSLKDHFPAWEPCWSVWINGNVTVKHRLRNGVHATHLNTVNAGQSIITGHLHSLKVTPFTDFRGVRWGVDTGTLADPGGPQFVDYTEDSGDLNHRSGFAVLTFHRGELLWPELVYARAEGEVEFRGKVFDVSGE